MVGEIVPRIYSLGDVLSEKQVDHIVKQSIGGDEPWTLEECEVKPAADGLAGYLGEHIKATLSVRIGEKIKKIHLFMKRIPMSNKPKADFINEFNYFRREKFIYKLLEEIGPDNDPNPWCSNTFLCTDTNIVMPDLTLEGYAPRNFRETLDLQHMLLAATSLARFHAAFTNYETKKSFNEQRPYNTYRQNKELFSEPTFCDSPWLRACAKLTVSLLDAFSSTYNGNIPDLETKLLKLYLDACDSLKDEDDTLNVLIHKDLWNNNIMFKYENNTPVNAILVDFQCLRYAPPSFDVMSFIYLTTSRSFREQHEREILLHYYKIFNESLDALSKKRLQKMSYDEKHFLMWCERSRMFGVFEAIGIYPFTLMEPKTGQRVFDDPDTYEKYINEDRSEPVLAHARRCSVYRDRQIEVSEEFLQRYVLKTL